MRVIELSRNFSFGIGNIQLNDYVKKQKYFREGETTACPLIEYMGHVSRDYRINKCHASNNCYTCAQSPVSEWKWLAGKVK